MIQTGHTDTVDTTSLHVPDLGPIVSGDVAYNHCHMYVGATTPGSRADWIAALDRLAALNPAAVVTGHKDPTQAQSARGPGRVPRVYQYYGQLRDKAGPTRNCSTPWCAATPTGSAARSSFSSTSTTAISARARPRPRPVLDIPP